MVNKHEKANTHLFNIITTILVCYITISSIYPPLRVLVSNNTLLVTICMFSWLFITFLRTPGFYLKITFHRIIILIFVVYSFIVPYVFNNNTIGNRYLNIAPVFFLYIVYEYNAKFSNSKNNLFIIKTIIPFALITLVKTGIGLVENPNLSRSIKSSGEYSATLFRQGIGGYEFIYFLVILFPVIVYLAFFSRIIKNKCHKLILLFSCVLVIAVILLSNYFTALVVAITSIIIMVVIRAAKKHTFYSLCICLFLLIIILLGGKGIALWILDSFANLIKSGRTLERIYEMRNSILYNNDNIISTSRWDLIKVSLTAFLNNPILGTVGNPQIDVLSFQTSAGQHSHLIDTFAFLGFLPGIAQIYIIIKPYLIRLRGSFLNELTLSVLYSVIMIFTFNTVTPSMGIVTSLIFPVVYDSIKLKECIDFVNVESDR